MKKDIVIHFNVPKQTLSDILKNKDKIRASCSQDNSLAPVAERQRSTLHPEVDKALIIWTRQKACRPDIRLDGTMLLQKANMFLRIFSSHVTNELSPAWIDRFKKCYGLGRIRKAGESGGVDTDVVNEWNDGKLREILENYRPDQIYNADETGLFWLLLPDNYLGFIGEKYHGTKQPKSRVTVLVASNMDGSDKLPMFVIGKSQKPRAFKNVKVPVEYVANKKAWMTSLLFESWLKRLDRKMSLQNKHIVMVVDNCPVHPAVELTHRIGVPTTKHYKSHTTYG